MYARARSFNLKWTIAKNLYRVGTWHLNLVTLLIFAGFKNIFYSRYSFQFVEKNRDKFLLKIYQNIIEYESPKLWCILEQEQITH